MNKDNNNMNRRTVLGALATVGVGTSVFGTASAKQNRRNGEDQVVEVIKDDNAWILLPADCLGEVSRGRREYLEGWLKARLTLQHDGDLQGEEAVHVRGSIGGEVERRYGNGVWHVKVHFPSPYAYVQSIEPRYLYLPDAEVVARPIRGNRNRPTLKSSVAIDIEDDGINLTGRRPVQCI